MSSGTSTRRRTATLAAVCAALVTGTTLAGAQPAEALSAKAYKNAKTYPYAKYRPVGYDVRGKKIRSCVSYAEWRFTHSNGAWMRNLGTATAWKKNALKAGYKVNKTPAKGAIAWWSRGHVAWMGYSKKHGWEIHEYNWDKPNKKGVRYLKNQSGGRKPDAYIHIKDLKK